MTNPQAEVTEGLASSVFDIAASASIPSDNSAHKVCVCVCVCVCVDSFFISCVLKIIMY